MIPRVGCEAITSSSLLPPIPQEVSVQTSNFAAEYGQVAGGLFNLTTKSGTNKFHGNTIQLHCVGFATYDAEKRNSWSSSPTTLNYQP